MAQNFIGFLRYLLANDGANTRFIFLVHGIIIAFCNLIVVIAFVSSKDAIAREGMSIMTGVLMGGQFGAFAGRKIAQKKEEKKEPEMREG